MNDVFLSSQACVQVGPTSVGYRLTSEALSFGGQQCTATDVAIASGMAPGDICASEEYRAAVGRLSPSRVYVAMRRMRLMLEAAIDSMKVCLSVCLSVSVRLA